MSVVLGDAGTVADLGDAAFGEVESVGDRGVTHVGVLVGIFDRLSAYFGNLGDLGPVSVDELGCSPGSLDGFRVRSDALDVVAITHDDECKK